MKVSIKIFSLVILFAIAMGFLEAAIVIYLREIYYKDGFQFPLRPMSMLLAKVEIWREFATIIMLIVIGYLAGKTKLQRFAYFCLSFAVWDLFYYVFLYIFLGWPQSLFTWDILFLIPLPWVGPVWAPCLLSLLMIIGSTFLIVQTQANDNYVINSRNWSFMILGATLCILSFMWDFLRYHLGEVVVAIAPISYLERYAPETFNYPLFFAGFAFMCYPVFIHTTKNQAT